jgi:hypothetical protein
MGFLPEERYGIAAFHKLFEGTTVFVECLQGNYESKNEQDLVTTQLVIEEMLDKCR